MAAGPSWLVDGNRFATKIKSASGACDPRVSWKSNPTKACPNCQHVFDNSDITQQWPGLPRGVKFDPSDQEIISHLLAKAGVGNSKTHPFLSEFIPTVHECDGICYTHPQNLPGVKQDGSVSHFFHIAMKAYKTGTRKRRKINGVDLGDVRWHKTGRTKPVILDGVQKGCKKIMVLYMSPVRGGKPEKTNWVMHQYHLGTGEDEKEGEYVISKVFYQQQQIKQSENNEGIDATDLKVDAISPKPVNPEFSHAERRFPEYDVEKKLTINCINTPAKHSEIECHEDEVHTAIEEPHNQDDVAAENNANQMVDENEYQAGEDEIGLDSGSQYYLNSQQLVEALALCDEFLQSRSPNRNGVGNGEIKGKPCLGDYAQLGPENFKRDLEECQTLVLDPENIERDAPPDFRLSQLEFESQESFVPWGGTKDA